MAKNSTSFQPGKSGNRSGRPKGVRTLARLIDSVGDEACAGTAEDFRTVTMRRLWEAAATGTLNLGKSSQKLKPEQWIRLVQWLVNHMDRVAVEQWAWQGQAQIHAEEELEAGEYDVEVVEEEEDAPMQGIAANYDDEMIADGMQAVSLLAGVSFSDQ